MPAHPYIRFFPDSWMNDASLRKCSRQTRATWIDLLCLAHQGTPYGHLSDANGALAVKFMANWCEVTPNQLLMAVSELEKNGVCSRTDDGIIFSRRMVRDEETRLKRAGGGAKSLENPNVPRRKDTLQGYPSRIPSTVAQNDAIREAVKDGPIDIESVSSSKSNSSSVEPFDPMDGWTRFKLAYPSHRINEYMDLRLWISVVDSQDLQDRILSKLEAFKRSVEWKENGGRFVPKASKFIGERMFDTEPGPDKSSSQQERPLRIYNPPTPIQEAV